MHFKGNNVTAIKKMIKLTIKQPKYRQPVYRWAIICQYLHFVHFWNFYFFLRIVNKCDNTDTENIKLIVETGYALLIAQVYSTF